MNSTWTVIESVVVVVIAGAIAACGSPASSGPSVTDATPLPGGQSGTDSMDTPPDFGGVVCEARSIETVAFEDELVQFGASPDQVYDVVEGQRALFPEDCSEAPSVALEVTRRPLAFVVEGATAEAMPCVELVLGVGVHVSASDRSLEESGSLLSLGQSGAILIPLGVEGRAQLSLQLDAPERIELQTWRDGRFAPSYVLATGERCERPVE